MFYKNINLIMTEAYFEELNKIRSWKMSSNFDGIQFPTMGASSIKALIT